MESEIKDESSKEIIQAAYAHNVSRVMDLLESGADVNAVDPENNFSLLHIGCATNDAHLVDVILMYNHGFGNVDFTIRCRPRARLAWEYALKSTDIGQKVQAAALKKPQRSGQLALG